MFNQSTEICYLGGSNGSCVSLLTLVLRLHATHGTASGVGSLWAGLKPDFLQVIARITAYPSKGRVMVSGFENHRFRLLSKMCKKRPTLPQPQKVLPFQTKSALHRIRYSSSRGVGFFKLKATQKARLRQSLRWQELLLSDSCN
jgi:hypothetical protein